MFFLIYSSYLDCGPLRNIRNLSKMTHKQTDRLNKNNAVLTTNTLLTSSEGSARER